MRLARPLIIGPIIVTFALFTFFYYTHRLTTQQQLSETISNITWRELAALPSLEIPITTAPQAIRFAVSQSTISTSLRGVTQTAHKADIDIKWQARALGSETIEGTTWSVRFDSINMLPSFTCLIMFTSDGSLLPSNQPRGDCSYNK